MLAAPPLLLAAPTDGVVASGAATITRSGGSTDIRQSTQKAVINWQGFSVGAGESVNFRQPSASAVTLNRVVGNEKSVIEGALNANGKVFLVNSGGILFTKGSSVNTGGLVASTLDIADGDFLAGRYAFHQAGGGRGGAVINMGTLAAADGGYVALLGGSVSNQGFIAASKGTVALAAGDKVTLNFNGNSLVNVTIDQGALDALVENRQAIHADGGTVLLTAKAADALLGSQVNNSGIVQAQTIDELKGSITLLADGGTSRVGGTLDASAPRGGNGGFIETSGRKVAIAADAAITTRAARGATGTWLIDPDGFTIASSGGDLNPAMLATLLGNNSIEIQSASGSGTGGDLNVNDAVAWASDTTLTLTATRDVNVNAAITATGTSAGLVLQAGHDVNVNAPIALSGRSAAMALRHGGDGGYNIRTRASYSGTTLDEQGSPVARQDTSGGVYGSVTLDGREARLSIQGEAYTLVRNMSQLAALDDATGTAAGHFALAKDFNAQQWSADHVGSAAVISQFSGTLAGLGHEISNLKLNAPEASNAGLIGSTVDASTIRDIGVTGVNITAASYVGALVGMASNVSIRNAYSTGNISVPMSGQAVGGLAGFLYGTIDSSHSDVDISAGTSTLYLGGLVGQAIFSTISRSHATGDTGPEVSQGAGGLVGSMSRTTVESAYATGNITGTSTSTNLGGLIGETTSTIDVGLKNSYATGNVSGGTNLGGLVGSIGSSNARGVMTIDNVRAGGDVNANQSSEFSTGNGVGGAIGYMNGSRLTVNISRARADGDVNVNSSYVAAAGGMFGSASVAAGSISDSQANVNVNASAMAEGWTGGLGGYASNMNVSNSHAVGNTTGGFTAGGLVGALENGTVTGSSASGSVSGYGAVGGLVGYNSHGQITDSSASGNVALWGESGTGAAGGLVGVNQGAVQGSRATGSVSGIGAHVGGLVGNNDNGTVTDSTYTDVAAQQKAEREKAERDKAEQEKAERDRLEKEKAEQEKAALEKAAEERAAQDKAAQEKANQEKAAQEKAALEKAAQEKAAAETAAAKAAADAAAQAAAEAAATAAAKAAAEAAAQAARFQARVSAATSAAAGQAELAKAVSRTASPLEAAGAKRPDSIDSHISFIAAPEYKAGVQAIEVDGVRYELEDDKKKESR